MPVFSHLDQVEFMSFSDFVRFLATPDAWLNEAKKLSHGVRDLLVGRHDVERQIELYLGFGCWQLHFSISINGDLIRQHGRGDPEM